MKRTTNSLQIREIFTSPQDTGCVSFGMTFAFSDAGDRLSEGSLTGFAPQSSFSDEQRDAMASDGRVLDAHMAMVIGRARGLGAIRAILGMGTFTAFVIPPKASSITQRDEFQFGKKDEF